MAYARSWQLTVPAAFHPPFRIVFTVKVVRLRLDSAWIGAALADHVANSPVWAQDDGRAAENFAECSRVLLAPAPLGDLGHTIEGDLPVRADTAKGSNRTNNRRIDVIALQSDIAWQGTAEHSRVTRSH